MKAKNSLISASGLTLAQRSLLLFTFAIIIQLLLIGSLLMVRDEDLFAVQAGRTRNISIAIRNLAKRSVGAILLVKIAPQNNATVDQGCEAYRKRINYLSEYLKKFWIKSPDNCKLVDNIVKKTNDLIVMERVGDQHVKENEDELEALLFQLIDPQRIPPAEDSKSQAQSRRIWFAVAVAGSLFNVGALGIFALFLNRQFIKRLNSLNEKMGQLRRGQRLASTALKTDEFGKLENAFSDLANTLLDAASRQRDLFDNAHDVLCYIDDSSFRFTTLNNASLKILGYEPKQLIGSEAIDIITQDDRKQAMENIRTLISLRAQPPFEMLTVNGDSFEARINKADGTTAHTLWTTKYMPAEKRLFCVISDISERKEAERLRNEVVQMVNHDLRSPLNAISIIYSILETGMTGQLNDQGKKSLKLASTSTELMLRLINDLLDIEKLEAGMLELDASTISLSSMIEQSIQNVQVQAQAKQIKFETAIANLNLYADEHRMVQVLINLLTNAIKFSPQGGTVTISALELPGFIEISVSDNGRGIPEHLLSKVFDRFRQVEVADAMVKGGSGLGLAICKALVELHGGTIAVESQSGQGSRFYFRIPTAQHRSDCA